MKYILLYILFTQRILSFLINNSSWAAAMVSHLLRRCRREGCSCSSYIRCLPHRSHAREQSIQCLRQVHFAVEQSVAQLHWMNFSRDSGAVTSFHPGPAIASPTCRSTLKMWYLAADDVGGRFCSCT